MKEYSEQELVRRQKLEEISKVCNPYPEKYERTHALKDASSLEDGAENVRLAGRIMFMRKMGKLSFIRIRDLEGSMQLELKVDIVGEEKYEFFKKMFDAGDFIGESIIKCIEWYISYEQYICVNFVIHYLSYCIINNIRIIFEKWNQFNVSKFTRIDKSICQEK